MGDRSRLEWRKWLEQNQRHLMDGCGLPLSVLESAWSWGYFLDHGRYTSQTGSAYPDVDIEQLPHHKALSLCLFLEDHINGAPADCVTLNRLQYLLKRGRHAEQ